MQVHVESPFPISQLPRLWQWCVTFRHQIMDDYGPQDEDAFNAEWLNLAERGLQTWAVYRTINEVRELGGIITVQPLNPICGAAFYLFKRQFWGKHTSEPAAREATRLAFEQNPDLRKINLTIFADNHQLRQLAKSLGYRREGQTRQATMRRGQLIDTLALGLTKEDFEKWLLSSPPLSVEQSELSAVS